MAPHRSPPCNTVNTKRLLFLCPVMMVTKKLEGVSKKWISVQKTAFLASKRALLGNEGPKTAAEQPNGHLPENQSYPELPQDMGDL